LAESLLPLLAGIIVVGIAAQWLAGCVGLPSIFVLLIVGMLVGPVGGWLHPDELFGDLLAPIVSISVALILYEGGLTLKMSEIAQVGSVVRNLVLLGAAATWLISAIAAHYILDFSAFTSALIAAVLVVTGPTVIAPLLRHLRPTGPVGPILKWEGILIDPIGALLAVLIFEAMAIAQIGPPGAATAHVIYAVAKTVVFGGGFGLVAAAILTLALYHHWIADHLENAVSLMLLVCAFALSDHMQHESGLLAATVMGFALANQRWVPIEHILEFKENLRVLLISALFIVLAARVDAASLATIAPTGLAFVAVLVFVARPLCVMVSTVRSDLTLRERLFLCWMAPRGIVAAAVASVFAIRLEEVGHPDATTLVPITFLTIIVTVAIYGLTSPLVARKLRVAESNPQGLLIVGASPWARQLATVLQREGFHLLLVDSNRRNTRDARMTGLPTYTGSVLTEQALDRIDLGGLGKVIAATPNDWVNVLTAHRFERVFGRAACYQLPPNQSGKESDRHTYLHGRWLFSDQMTHHALEKRLIEGYVIKATRLTETFDYAAFLDRHGETPTPLFVIDARKRLTPITANTPCDAQPEDTIIALVKEPPAHSA
jgi:NhaP-type Na+/H+ or K+/H+ antiporter